MAAKQGLVEAEPGITLGGKLLNESEIVELLEEAGDNQQLLEERLVELELALEDREWIRLDSEGTVDFSRWALLRIIEYSRKSYLTNPLINHGVEVQADYVWAQGFNVTSKDESVNKIIQTFLGHPRNDRVLTGHVARVERDRQVALEGNIFFTLISGADGSTVVRLLPTEEIINGDIVLNPEDRTEPRFYKRRWTRRGNKDDQEAREDLYPDARYLPAEKPDKVDGIDVHWDMPVVHLKDGGLPGAKFGVPTVYPALDWAREVRRDLEAYATIRRALASFAWKVKTKGGKAGVTAAKQRLETTVGKGSTGGGPDLPTTNPPPSVGSYWVGNEGRDLEPLRTAGSQSSPDEGRRLWLMVAAGVGLPETILSGDADIGNLATAKTLDRPTELKMRNRQEVWSATFRTILQYVVLKAQSGDNDPDLNQPDLPEIDISFPNILEEDKSAAVTAVVDALTLGGKSPLEWANAKPRVMAKMLLEALGVDDIDGTLEEFFPKGEGAENIPAKATTPPEDALAAATQDLAGAVREARNGRTRD